MLNYQRVYVVVDLNINNSQYLFKEKNAGPIIFHYIPNDVPYNSK